MGLFGSPGAMTTLLGMAICESVFVCNLCLVCSLEFFVLDENSLENSDVNMLISLAFGARFFSRIIIYFGCGCSYNQTYTWVIEDTAKDAFNMVGIKFHAKNYAMGQ